MAKGKTGSGAKPPRSKNVADKESSSLARPTRGRKRGRGRDEAAFPVAPPRAELPGGYVDALSEIKNRIQQTRLKTVLAANSAMILLYWDIGRLILERQEKEGWGAKVIDRLSSDLRDAYPDMTGLSSRNLKYMRAFAAAWPEPEIVQEALAQITWYHNLALLEKLDDSTVRLWYARQTVENGWSRNILALQIESRLHQRQGMAVTNFSKSLPPGDSDMASQVFKDPYLCSPQSILRSTLRSSPALIGSRPTSASMLRVCSCGFHGEALPLDVRGQEQEIHDLGEASASELMVAGVLGVVFEITVFNLRL